MNKRIWLFSILTAVFFFCTQAPCIHAQEEKSPQQSLGMEKPDTGIAAGGTMGSFNMQMFKNMPKAGESDYPPFFGDDISQQPGAQPGTQPSTQPGGQQGEQQGGQNWSQQGGQPGGQNWSQPGAQGGNGAAELDGAWAASDGKDSIIILFKGNACCIAINSNQICGTYTAANGNLSIQLQNGSTNNFTYRVQGNQLILNNGATVLIRQQMPAQQGGGWGNSPAPQGGSGGGWGGSPAPQGGNWGGNPAPQGGSGGNWGGAPAPQGPTMLEGCWASINMPFPAMFCFQGNRYMFRANSNPPSEETGTFVLQGNQLHYTIMTGSSAGRRGTNTVYVQNNVLTMQFPNGSVAYYRKAQ